MKPAELVDKYYNLLDQKAKLDEEIETVREEMFAKLNELGLRSFASDKATVFKAKRTYLNVDEKEFRRWAQEQPDLELDMFYVSKLDKDKVKQFSQKHLKETGEIVPYITASETEYLTVKSAEKTGQNA